MWERSLICHQAMSCHMCDMTFFVYHISYPPHGDVTSYVWHRIIHHIGDVNESCHTSFIGDVNESCPTSFIGDVNESCHTLFIEDVNKSCPPSFIGDVNDSSISVTRLFLMGTRWLIIYVCEMTLCVRNSSISVTRLFLMGTVALYRVCSTGLR